MKPVDNFISDISSWKTEYSINASTIITKAEALENVTDNVYFVSGLKSWLTRRCTAKDFINKRYFFLDFDIQSDLTAWGYGAESANEWGKIILEYKDNLLDILSWWYLSDWRYCIFSWRGLHLYYISEEPVEVGNTGLTPQQYRQWVISIHETLKQEMNTLECEFTRSIFVPDSKCTDIGRLARLPWSYNHKWEAIKTSILDYQDVYTEKLYWFGEIIVDEPSKANSNKPLLPLAPYHANKELLRNYNSYSSMLKHVVPIRSLIPLLNKEYNIKAHTNSLGASIYRDRKTPRVIFVSRFNNLEKNWSQNEWYRLLKDFPSLQGQKLVNIYDIASLVTDWRITNFKNWLKKKGLMEISKILDNFDNQWHLEDKNNPFKSIPGQLEDTKWHNIPEEHQNVNKVPLKAEFDILKKTCKDKQKQKNQNKGSWNIVTIPWNIHDKTLIKTKVELSNLKNEVSLWKKIWKRYGAILKNKWYNLYEPSTAELKNRYKRLKEETTIDNVIEVTVKVFDDIVKGKTRPTQADISVLNITDLIKKKIEEIAVTPSDTNTNSSSWGAVEFKTAKVEVQNWVQVNL